MTGYLYKIKKIVISVDRKKYTKNEINISDKVMLINYSKPGKTNGKITISMKNPEKDIKIIKYGGDNNILEFDWADKDEFWGKTLRFKIEFERPIDGDRTYFALIKKLDFNEKSNKPKKSIKRAKSSRRQKTKKKKIY